MINKSKYESIKYNKSWMYEPLKKKSSPGISSEPITSISQTVKDQIKMMNMNDKNRGRSVINFDVETLNLLGSLSYDENLEGLKYILHEFFINSLNEIINNEPTNAKLKGFYKQIDEYEYIVKSVLRRQIEQELKIQREETEI